MSGVDVSLDSYKAYASAEKPVLSPAPRPGSAVKTQGHSGKTISGRALLPPSLLPPLLLPPPLAAPDPPSELPPDPPLAAPPSVP